jgi:hypothetical protein
MSKKLLFQCIFTSTPPKIVSSVAVPHLKSMNGWVLEGQKNLEMNSSYPLYRLSTGTSKYVDLHECSAIDGSTVG